MTFNDEESLIEENGMTLGLEQLTEPKKSKTEPNRNQKYLIFKNRTKPKTEIINLG